MVLAFFIPLVSVALYVVITEGLPNVYGIDIVNPLHLPSRYQCGSLLEYVLVTLIRPVNVVGYLPWLILAVRNWRKYPGLALGMALGTGIVVWPMITNIVFYYNTCRTAAPTI
jgi:hypothetical protein